MQSGGRGDEYEASDTFSDQSGFVSWILDINTETGWMTEGSSDLFSAWELRMKDVHCCLNSNIWMLNCLLWNTQTPELSHNFDQNKKQQK